MAALEVNRRSRSPSLARLAVVYAEPLRMKIVTELYLRVMSPKQFHDEFGGGSVSRVDYHFKKLADAGWLELMETRSGGHRRSATEHFYRATDLVIFDLERWSEVPASVRASFSLMTFEQLTERVVAAMEAGTFNARPNRHLTWTPLCLDGLGWKHVLAGLEDLFEIVLEEQGRARMRIAESAEMATLVTVGFAGFEAATPLHADPLIDDAKEPLHGIRSSGAAGDPMHFFPMHLSKVFGDPLALRIIAEANLREISPSQFRDEFGGGTASDLGKRFKRLAKAGWLEQSSIRPATGRRGGPERLYRAISPAILDNEDWSELPRELQATLSWETFNQLREKVLAAIGKGTFDAHADRHLTWCLLHLDQLGWKQITAAIDTFFKSLFIEERKASLRMASSDEEPITMIVTLAAFESPVGGKKAH